MSTISHLMQVLTTLCKLTTLKGTTTCIKLSGSLHYIFLGFKPTSWGPLEKDSECPKVKRWVDFNVLSLTFFLFIGS